MLSLNERKKNKRQQLQLRFSRLVRLRLILSFLPIKYRRQICRILEDNFLRIRREIKRDRGYGILSAGDFILEYLNADYACRSLFKKLFGRGFDSRRLHQTYVALTPVFKRRLCRQGVALISKQKPRAKTHKCLGPRFLICQRLIGIQRPIITDRPPQAEFILRLRVPQTP